MRAFSTAPAAEKELAFHAIDTVRRTGGVLEHPAGSSLWPVAGLPGSGKRDKYGFTFGLDQFWLGHLARKRTLLYICGIEPSDMPSLPLTLKQPAHMVTLSKWRPEVPAIPKSMREATPLPMAHFLVHLARLAA
ncbi:MAG: hypothetical protein AABY95_01525 [Pseudomonadota bacterium]